MINVDVTLFDLKEKLSDHLNDVAIRRLVGIEYHPPSIDLDEHVRFIKMKL